jgi:hypothetical protein
VSRADVERSDHSIDVSLRASSEPAEGRVVASASGAADGEKAEMEGVIGGISRYHLSTHSADLVGVRLLPKQRVQAPGNSIVD